MIAGIGTDIVCISHFEQALSKMGEKGIQRLFTPAEQACANARSALTIQTYAKRFAAKEAVAKALGTGIGTVAWTQIEVTNNAQGAPFVQLHGDAAKLLASKGEYPYIHLSLSDDGDYAQAFVIIEVAGSENA